MEKDFFSDHHEQSLAGKIKVEKTDKKSGEVVVAEEFGYGNEEFNDPKNRALIEKWEKNREDLEREKRINTRDAVVCEMVRGIIGAIPELRGGKDMDNIDESLQEGIKYLEKNYKDKKLGKAVQEAIGSMDMRILGEMIGKKLQEVLEETKIDILRKQINGEK